MSFLEEPDPFETVAGGVRIAIALENTAEKPPLEGAALFP